MAAANRFFTLPLGILLGASALLAAPVMLSTTAHATSIAPLSLEQLVDGSDLIVRGNVTDVWTGSDRMGLTTHILVRVEKTLKGTAAADIEIVVPGGTIDGSTSYVDGAPRYGVGEHVLLLLNARSDGTYLNVAMASGKYTIRQNPADGSDMVVQFFVPYDRAWDHRFIPNPAVADRISLSAMETRLTDRVTLGWDGKAIPGISLDHLREINRLQTGVR
ncbi:MAG: hypothetical protein EXR69_15505 [Myxococcales bacterium]|nr:hypothetical protein [Myxococcales bacterium]